VGLSTAHFARMFRKSTGETPHQFVLRQRLERAKAMLRAPDARVLDVAVACGFKTQQHFAQVFVMSVELARQAIARILWTTKRRARRKRRRKHSRPGELSGAARHFLATLVFNPSTQVSDSKPESLIFLSGSGNVAEFRPTSRNRNKPDSEVLFNEIVRKAR
jgi:AraC-like DNA-binding protein